MPEWEEIYTSAYDAVEDLKEHSGWNEEGEEVDLKVVDNEPHFLVVVHWKGKPSTLNCYAYSCTRTECNERLACLEEAYV
jgi:hypothetical protein